MLPGLVLIQTKCPTIPSRLIWRRKTLTSFFDGYRFVKRIEVGGATDYLLLFRKGNETRLARGTTSKVAHNVVIKTNAPDFKLIPCYRLLARHRRECAPIHRYNIPSEKPGRQSLSRRLVVITLPMRPQYFQTGKVTPAVSCETNKPDNIRNCVNQGSASSQ